jgi:predicted O-methyltransferase YrrM
MNATYRATSYIRFLRHSVSRHKIHSPFVYEFIEKVLKGKGVPDGIQEVLSLKKQLRKEKTLLTKEDHGAGSIAGKVYNTSVRKEVKGSVSTNHQLRVLYRISLFVKAAKMIELGTSLGISSAVLAMGNPEGKLVTIEGSPEIAERAATNLKELGISNVNIVTGDFKDELKGALEQAQQPGLVFIDGNHRQGPTLEYFNECLEYKGNDTVIVLHDIHWSKEMNRAWEEVKKYPEVRATIETYSTGYIFFRKELSPQHFVIRY